MSFYTTLLLSSENIFSRQNQLHVITTQHTCIIQVYDNIEFC